MKPVLSHKWDCSEEEAKDLQIQLAQKVLISEQVETPRYVAGVDVGYSKESDAVIGGVVVIDLESMAVVDQATFSCQVTFPYITGLFSFREIPPLLKALESLNIRPDLIVCDGQGIAHPRRFGLACHLGVLLDIPTVGCAKNSFTGTFDEPGLNRGDYSFITENDEVLGAALRTQDNVRPAYVSVGHKVNLSFAIDLILKLASEYRLPETTRQSDQLVRKCLKDE